MVPPLEEIDLAGAERAAADFLTALGVATDTAATTDTPARMARAYAEMLSPRSFDLTTFPNDEGYDELVLARAIPVQSVCEHHMLPFLGTAHVGYLPGQRILGLSKLARVVELFARRPQVQERLTMQVADWLQTHLRPRGVGVVIEAEHLCMSGARGAGRWHQHHHLGPARGAARGPAVPRGVPRPDHADPVDAGRWPSWLTGSAS